MAWLRIAGLRWMQSRIKRALTKQRAQGNDIIIFLYRLFVKELEDNGYDVTGGSGTSTRVYLSIFQHQDEVEIGNNNGWKVRGRGL